MYFIPLKLKKTSLSKLTVKKLTSIHVTLGKLMQRVLIETFVPAGAIGWKSVNNVIVDKMPDRVQ